LDESNLKDEAELIRQLRELRKDQGGTGHGRIYAEIRDDRVQLIEATRKTKVDNR
jgi:hypothetical protein